ncbi:MAG: GntP family permease [Fuerstiella sp.]
MPTVLILIAGLVIVIGGILLFRLHAFVALILAGLTVAILTPAELVVRSTQVEKSLRNVVVDAEAGLLLSAAPLKGWSNLIVAADPGDRRALRRVGDVQREVPLTEWKQPIPFETSVSDSESNSDSKEPGPACYQLNFDKAFDASESAVELRVLNADSYADAQATGRQSFMSRLTLALGSYCGQLAILIVAASIIGRCLLDSGAADCIVRSALNTVGEKNAPAAFVVSGFTLSIPVFFDTVFYLMIPLGKALRLRTGCNYLLYVLSIVAGGTMAHSLVPPTPGPLFIAEAFDVSIAAMIAGGCIVGLFSSSVGMLYAVWCNRRYELALPSDDLPEHNRRPESFAANESGSSIRKSPGLWVSLTPILLPVLLITLQALVLKTESSADDSTHWTFAGLTISESVAEALLLVGEKNFALLVSAAFAVLMYVRTQKPTKAAFADAMQHAVSSAGTIILVTAAGGAFGRMMRQTSVAELLQGLPGTSPVMVVIAAFLVTTAVRTAQGSSTVAMITAAGIFGGLVTSGSAGVDPLYVALAVGCGSKPIAWMNDSGFWVITRMSGMSEKEGLRYITPMTAIAGVAGLVAVILGVLLFP